MEDKSVEMNNEQGQQPEAVEAPEVNETQKLKDQMLRLAAELENLRKRTQKEIEEAHKYSVAKFARDLIEILENLYRAESSIPLELAESNEHIKQLLEGVSLTKKSLTQVFDKYGIKRIEPLNEAFDHRYHQAIMQVKSEAHKNNDVVQVVQAGYIINDRLLRPALVAVAKND
jgi:molecular chaperone GrpE